MRTFWLWFCSICATYDFAMGTNNWVDGDYGWSAFYFVVGLIQVGLVLFWLNQD